MMDRQAEAEWRISRADQDAAERAAAAQERARMARIERLEQRVRWAINSLFAVMMTLWLLGLGVIIVWGCLP